MNDIIVIYHGKCDDGFGAAYAAWKHFGDKADYRGATHGSCAPDVAGREVYILDFSYSRSEIERMASEAREIVLIDHHKTAKAELEGLPFAFIDLGHSGASLAWHYFHPDAPLPRLLRHVEDNDLWRFDLPETRPFIRNLRSHPQEFEQWDNLVRLVESEPFYHDFVERGRAQERFFARQCAEALESSKMEIYIDGVRGLAANVSRVFASEVGHQLALESGTFGLCWYLGVDGRAKCSLRSVGEFDVSELARRFGGGGHRNAAGFGISFERLVSMLSWSAETWGDC